MWGDYQEPEPDIENNVQVSTSGDLEEAKKSSSNSNSFLMNLIRRIMGLDSAPVVKSDLPLKVFVEVFDIEDLKETCSLCLSKKERITDSICRLNCCHEFCVFCIDQHLKQDDCCPECDTKIVAIQTQTVEAKEFLECIV